MHTPLPLVPFLSSLVCFFVVAGPAVAVVVVPTLLLPVVVVDAVAVAAAIAVVAVFAVAAAVAFVDLRLLVALVVHTVGSSEHTAGPFFAECDRFGCASRLPSVPSCPWLVGVPYRGQALC